MGERRRLRCDFSGHATAFSHRGGAAPEGWRGDAGQATVELVAAVPALLLAALISLQLLAAGYALTLGDGAAEAGGRGPPPGGAGGRGGRRAAPPPGPR